MWDVMGWWLFDGVVVNEWKVWVWFEREGDARECVMRCGLDVVCVEWLCDGGMVVCGEWWCGILEWWLMEWWVSRARRWIWCSCRRRRGILEFYRDTCWWFCSCDWGWWVCIWMIKMWRNILLVVDLCLCMWIWWWIFALSRRCRWSNSTGTRWGKGWLSIRWNLWMWRMILKRWMCKLVLMCVMLWWLCLMLSREKCKGILLKMYVERIRFSRRRSRWRWNGWYCLYCFFFFVIMLICCVILLVCVCMCFCVWWIFLVCFVSFWFDAIFFWCARAFFVVF